MSSRWLMKSSSLKCYKTGGESYGFYDCVLCVVCDGMGGLAKGELASATVIRTFENWFEKDFPAMLERGFDPEELRLQWDNIVLEQNQKISA